MWWPRPCTRCSGSAARCRMSAPLSWPPASDSRRGRKRAALHWRGVAGGETVVLHAGMTFAAEPLIWVPGVPGGAGVRLEHTILVTDDGGRALTRTGWDERLLLRG
ncbi:MAG: M24 family metallopeptidase [Candidatus Dormibacteraeota bacterium]|uniref:M24 family metallopeptidase n=1 Tax=Candidatus Dormiibacter inghamiae TaxID=3127013 RepID=A0A934KDN1_9BACT|nr:M24 family metallopeptidase [Candidatus Dormibacteraeota bacterium]MBJ7606172.1 M24 family metallopeptidase [Candidatus Dormibacteraeota bacterium]